MTAIIDADSIPYIVSHVADKHGQSLKEAFDSLDSIINKIFKRTYATNFICYTTGKNNFRKEINTEYKANRDNKLKETNKYYYPVLKYMKDKYKCYNVIGAEADDLCTYSHKAYKDSVLVSIDKDLLQSEGVHYNYRTDSISRVTYMGSVILRGRNKLRATGRKLLWCQMITGDTVDNIKGVAGKGPVTAYKIISNCNSEEEMEREVRKLYLEAYGDKANDIFNNTYKLLYMPSTLNVDLPAPILINSL